MPSMLFVAILSDTLFLSWDAERSITLYADHTVQSGFTSGLLSYTGKSHYENIVFCFFFFAFPSEVT